MKNYSNEAKSTTIEKINEGANFVKITDLFPNIDENNPVNFGKDALKILGYLKTHSAVYNKDQYALYVNFNGVYYLLNVSTWYGKRVEDDFIKSGLTAADFFKDVSISTIEAFKTKFNTLSYNIKIFE